MTRPKVCDGCGRPFKDHVREGRVVFCFGPDPKRADAQRNQTIHEQWPGPRNPQ